MCLINDFFAQEPAEGNILGFFSGYFIINFSRMRLWDQIFSVLLEHFISEVVRISDSRIKCFRFF